LVRPCILALLARGPAHGYALLERLNETGLLAVGSPDHSVVYRTLNAMEKEGLLKSKRSGSSGGPTRWEYTLTATGRGCLRRWQNSLTGYRSAIDGLLKLMS
jgi:PadR family transcriptional regulator PadR